MQSKSPSCQCQLCHKEFEVRQLQHMHRREMSLQTVYRKDYHNQAMQPTLALPARKNESSNIRGQPKSYFSLNSTYEANYQPNNPQAPVPPYKPACIGRPESLQNYKSTYRSNYLQHGAARKEESFKIADPQFYNLKTPFPQLTQYTKSYQARQSQRGSQEKRQPRPEQKKSTIRLFQTTQRHSYLNAKQVHHNLPIIPQNNVTTLPTNSSLFSTTYRNEFAKRSRVTATDLEKHSKHLVDLYHF